jgi:hypothetical protein
VKEQQPRAEPSYVVTFFVSGAEVRARVHDTGTREGWVVRNGALLRTALLVDQERPVRS